MLIMMMMMMIIMMMVRNYLNFIAYEMGQKFIPKNLRPFCVYQ
jgi:mannose/fructose/N-acetylgalactosamine-specific phosphotransferase system component IID